MPKIGMNYQNTIMYKIVPKDLNLDLIYIGHTTNFTKRKNTHKSSCISSNRKEYTFKVYQMIRENGGWDNWDMIEIEKYPCNDKNEACKRERELMEEHNANLNMIKSCRSKQEYIDEKQKSDKKYYESHKERHLLNSKIYYEKNKETITEYKSGWFKKHYSEKKELIAEQRKNEFLTCECGSVVRKSDISTHKRKTLKHQQYLESLVNLI